MTGYSVVIPAWNAETTLGETLASVVAQHWRPDEIVVVDDGSTDRTAEIARAADARVRVISQPNTGVGLATNAGIIAARSSHIALLDADDLWHPEKCARQRQMLEEPATLHVICTEVQLFRTDAKGNREMGPVRSGLLRSTMMFHRDVFARVGPLIEPPGGRGEMVDWLGRCRAAGIALVSLPEPLVLRRVHPGSLSQGRDPVKDKGYLLAARRSILRARSTSADAGDPEAKA